MDRPTRERCVAHRGTDRSESRKRERRSESPDTPTGRLSHKHFAKKHKRTGHDKDQTKITAYSEVLTDDTPADNTPDRTLEESESVTNMADVVNKTQFDMLMEEFHKMGTKMDQYMQRMDDRVTTVEGKVHVVENKTDKNESDIDTLCKRVERNEERTMETVHAATLALDYAEKNEQYQRNFNIRIINLPEKDNETIEECEAAVLNLFANTLGVTVPIEAIDILHRLGPMKKTSTASEQDNTEKEPDNSNSAEGAGEGAGVEGMETGQTADASAGTAADTGSSNAQAVPETNKTSNRPVRVSFVSRRVRREILFNRRKLKKKVNQTSAQIVIVEDLTKKRHALFSKARENKEKYKKVWSREGKIYGRQHNGIDTVIESFLDISSPPVQKKPQYGRFNWWRGGPRGRGGYRGRGRGGAHPSYPPQWYDGYNPGDNIQPDDGMPQGDSWN